MPDALDAALFELVPADGSATRRSHPRNALPARREPPPDSVLVSPDKAPSPPDLTPGVPDRVDSGDDATRDPELQRIAAPVRESGKAPRSTVRATIVRRRVLISLNLDRVIAHLLRYVDEPNVERIELIFDEGAPIGSTRDMRTWYTTRPTIGTVKTAHGSPRAG